MKLELAPCVPPLWAPGGHAQTIFAHLIPSPRLDREGERVELLLPDGDRVIARHYPGLTGVTVYLFHGLSSDIHEDYMRRSAKVCLDLGHELYLMNHRGCGEGRGLARRPYHSGIAEDLSEMIAYGRARSPGKRHIAMGVSLSGNALLLLCSGARGTTLPDAAITFNAPIDLQACARLLSQGPNRIYDVRFVLRLRRELREKLKAGLLDREYAVSPLARVTDFDAIYTAVAAGFKDREDYYATCSTKGLLDRIRIPTIVFTAEDDPFIPFSAYREAKLSPSVHLHAEKHGGHVGYLTRERTPLGTHRWLDYALHEALKALAPT